MHLLAVARVYKGLIYAIVLCAIAPAALAQWYVGGGLGQSNSRYKSDNLTSDLSSGGITGTGTAGGSSTSGRLFAGYQIYEVFALEAGYFYLGDYLSVNGTYSKPLPASTFSGTTKGQGADLDLVWTVPVARSFLGIARVGGALFRADPAWTANAAAFTTMSGAARKNNLVAEAGLGLQYDFTKTIAARLEWQRFFNVGVGLASGSAPIDYYSAGMLVKF
jgi:hypothetical protein